MKTPVDLGIDYDSCGCCVPVSPGQKKGEKVYPTLHIDSLPEDALELPDEGTMTVKFRVSRETEDKKAGKCSYAIDILSVESVDGAAPEKKPDTGTILDELAAVVRKASGQELPQDLAGQKLGAYLSGEQE